MEVSRIGVIGGTCTKSLLPEETRVKSGNLCGPPRESPDGFPGTALADLPEFRHSLPWKQLAVLSRAYILAPTLVSAKGVNYASDL